MGRISIHDAISCTVRTLFLVVETSRKLFKLVMVECFIINYFESTNKRRKKTKIYQSIFFYQFLVFLRCCVYQALLQYVSTLQHYRSLRILQSYTCTDCLYLIYLNYVFTVCRYRTSVPNVSQIVCSVSPYRMSVPVVYSCSLCRYHISVRYIGTVPRTGTLCLYSMYVQNVCSECRHLICTIYCSEFL